MYLPIPPQPDCVSAWRAAVQAVDDRPGHEAQNVIIDVADPLVRSTLADPAVAIVDNFLRQWDAKPIETVANTLFPAALHRRHGSPAFYDRFTTRVLPAAARGGDRWSGYYFERMINLPRPGGGVAFNQLADIIGRLKDPSVKALNKFELSVFDPLRDVDRSPYGGQCLSHASFKPERSTDGDRLHPLQEAFIAESAFQCGFCTPGMLMTCSALLDEMRESNRKPSEEDIRRAISGNLCRCTGYLNIVKAVQYAAQKMG